MVEGIQLDKYIKKNGLNLELTKNIYKLIKEFKRLDFSKIDTRCKDVYVKDDCTIMLIDPKKCYKRKSLISIGKKKVKKRNTKEMMKIYTCSFYKRESK